MRNNNYNSCEETIKVKVKRHKRKDERNRAGLRYNGSNDFVNNLFVSITLDFQIVTKREIIQKMIKELRLNGDKRTEVTVHKPPDTFNIIGCPTCYRVHEMISVTNDTMLPTRRTKKVITTVSIRNDFLIYYFEF